MMVAHKGTYSPDDDKLVDDHVGLLVWAERHSRRIGMIEADKRKQEPVQSDGEIPASA